MLRPRVSTSGGQSAGGPEATAVAVVDTALLPVATSFFVCAAQEANDVQLRHLLIGRALLPYLIQYPMPIKAA